MYFNVPYLAIIRGVVRQRPQVCIGIIVSEYRMEPPVDGPSFLVVKRKLALIDEAVDYRIGVADEVVLPRSDLPGMVKR